MPPMTAQVKARALSFIGGSFIERGWSDNEIQTVTDSRKPGGLRSAFGPPNRNQSSAGFRHGARTFLSAARRSGWAAIEGSRAAVRTSVAADRNVQCH